MKALEEGANKDMEREISERKKVIKLLSQGKKFIMTQLWPQSQECGCQAGRAARRSSDWLCRLLSDFGF